MRVVIKKNGWLKASSVSPIAWVGLGLAGFLLVGSAAFFSFFYFRYSRIIDERLQGPVFPNVSQIYAAPEELRIGDKANVGQIVSSLRSAGLSERQENPKGYFTTLTDGIRVMPGAASYFAQEPAEIRLV